ncbi:MAG: NAD(P)/FAD-dependent oxidoreductase [Bacteroidia bacterium]|nr:NAD(P)/FAD-dependent oxidoreductase [Bacteroidia bacterium]
MSEAGIFEVIIVGGSYAGLAAAMTLGRALRSVLIIDSGQPCNIQTPYSHNFLTQDGVAPAKIAELAKNQVLNYQSVKFRQGKALKGYRDENVYVIELESGEKVKARKLIFTTGVRDILPEIKGLAECWGISALHCPYCHGYEVKNQKTGILGNGDAGFEFARLINNWTKDLILFTNGKSELTASETEKLNSHNILINEREIKEIQHKNGHIEKLVFTDNAVESLHALYVRGGFSQHCEIPVELGCEITETGYIKVDEFQRTTVAGIYAAGDNTTMFRSVSAAVAAGNKAGAILNKELVDENF